MSRCKPCLAPGCSTLAAVALLLAPHAGPARSDCRTAPPAPSPMLYELVKDSSIETGCFPPCMCPVLVLSGMRGTFALQPAGGDGLFHHYALREIDWVVPSSAGSEALRVRGEGCYRVGGEFVAQHELTLWVSLNGGATQRLTSGLIPGGNAFPMIDIRVAAHGFFCWDTVLTVSAAPAAAGVVFDRGGLAALGARPNPFGEAVDLDLVLRRPGPVSLVIVDLQGRAIRTLVREAWSPAGTRVLRWDGRDDAGAAVPAGLYFVRLRHEDREMTRRLVRR